MATVVRGIIVRTQILPVCTISYCMLVQRDVQIQKRHMSPICGRIVSDVDSVIPAVETSQKLIEIDQDIADNKYIVDKPLVSSYMRCKLVVDKFVETNQEKVRDLGRAAESCRDPYNLPINIHTLAPTVPVRSELALQSDV